MLREGLFQGWVQHQRHHPKKHQFQYPLAMVMVDVDSIDEICARSRFWSWQRFNLISLFAKDYLAPHQGDIKTAVAEKIFAQCGEKLDGKVMMLTHPRYFGFVFNPVSFYFCYDAKESLRYIIAEINNTPWNERYSYVLAIGENEDMQDLRFRFGKQFHISPFMPMAIDYDWHFSLDGNDLNIHMMLLRNGQREFDAMMQTQFKPLTSAVMRRLPIQFPIQTILVVGRIYWQAFRLWMKRVPVFEHSPAKSSAKPIPKQRVNGESP